MQKLKTNFFPLLVCVCVCDIISLSHLSVRKDFMVVC